jgi:hypothetical protein
LRAGTRLLSRVAQAKTWWGESGSTVCRSCSSSSPRLLLPPTPALHNSSFQTITIAVITARIPTLRHQVRPLRCPKTAKTHSSLPRERQTQAPSFSYTRLCFSQYQIAYHDTHYDSSKGQLLEPFSALRMVKKSLWKWRFRPS